MVELGEDKVFDSADKSRADTGGLQWGNASVSTNEDNNHSEAGAKASLGGITARYAWSETGKTFEVEGDGSREATITVSGNFAASQSAFLVAGSTTKVEILVYTPHLIEKMLLPDEWMLDELSNTVVHENTVKFLGLPSFDEEFEESVTLDLQGGEKYFVAVRAKGTAWAEPLGPFPISTAVGSLTTYSTPGFVEWDEMELTWE